MSVRENLRTAVRDVLGLTARSHGFKGTSPTWRRTTPSGDWAIVNLQSSTSSTASSVRCVLNTSVAPEPWLRWTRVQMGTAMPKAVPESMGLYRQRLLPSGTPDGTEGWWQVDSPHRVDRVIDDMRAQLERRSRGSPPHGCGSILGARRATRDRTCQEHLRASRVRRTLRGLGQRSGEVGDLAKSRCFAP